MNPESENNPNVGQGNPAWEEFWNAIPENYREEVQPNLTPILQKWDQGVQQRFDRYKPFDKYVKDGVDPQVLDYGVNLINKLDSNEGAMEIFGELGKYLESQGLLGQDEDEDDEDEEFDYNSLPPQLRRQIEELQNAYGTLAEHSLYQEQSKQEAAEDAALDAELSELQKKYGDFDEEYVLVKMMHGMGAEDAVKSYHSWLDNTLKSRSKPATYRPLGAGADFPTNGQFNARKASDREVSDHVTQMLFDIYNQR